MKEYILKNKKCLVNHVITLGILLVGFILGRYVFFDVHGMKEFPVVLLVLGLVVMVISVLTTKKILPYFISVGYIIGFVFGFIFQVTKMDANGVSVNNLWVIWTVVYVAFIVLGFICEWCFRKYGSSVDWKKNKSTKIIIAIPGIVILWLCVGIVDFALVHNYRRPLFCVCTESMQDGGSGKYVGLGYSFDIEGNFMPEAKNPGVTSYRGYILGKEVCRGFWEKMDVDKLIYGDINRTEEPDEYPPLDIIPGADLDEPGELMESITVEYLGAGQIKKWSVSSELIDDVMEWYADLDYKKVTFKDGESPADGEGQTVYDIEFSDGTSFAYYDCGTENYIRKDGTWYKVKNPKLPPVGEPV